MVYKMLEQRCREWDYTFVYLPNRRSTESSISLCGTSLAHFGIGMPYIDLLKRSYAEQKGTVMTDKESDLIETKKGTKQGDPLSSLLLKTVLQYALEGDLKRWQEGNKGICLGCQKRRLPHQSPFRR